MSKVQYVIEVEAGEQYHLLDAVLQDIAKGGQVEQDQNDPIWIAIKNAIATSPTRSA